MRRFEGRQDKAEAREREYIAEKPVKPGEELVVRIESVGTRGDGLARVQNFVIFVPDTTAGEECKVRITAVHSKFAAAEKIESVQRTLEGKPALESKELGEIE